MTTPELVAIFTESDHTTDIVKSRFPDLPVPIYRTHSSGNGRKGEHAGFRFGEWPRKKLVTYFDYKHADDNASLFRGLRLPEGWGTWCLSGMDDDRIAEMMRTCAIFVATNRFEGMCAPTSEAMISGSVIVCWTGGGPDEYLQERAVIAKQDDVDALRGAIEHTAADIDRRPEWWAEHTKNWSEWFQHRYSREREVEEICGLFDRLLATVPA
jgi:glycosyltransferase involved in cell wall biosynthesis